MGQIPGQQYYEEALADFFEFHDMAESTLLESTFGENRYLELYPSDERGYRVMWTIFTESEIEDFRKTGVYSTYPERFFLQVPALGREEQELAYQAISLWNLESWNRIHEEMKDDLAKQYSERTKRGGEE